MIDDAIGRVPPKMAQVEFTRHLTTLFPQLAQGPVRLDAATVAEVVQGLERLAPGIAFYICDERGRLRRHVNIFVGDEMVVDRRGLSDALDGDTRVFIAQALSGG
jgi:hypothetical protein